MAAAKDVHGHRDGDADGLRIVLIAGEHSGDALGAKLMAALSARRPGQLQFDGVGGEAMAREGLSSLFPLSDVAVMGPLAIARRLPRIVRRVYQTVDAAVAAAPHAVVIIDSPDFTHPIARRIRRRLPGVPIIDFVSPSVWAWRPKRAPRMRRYVDHVLALLPFEPEVHRRLGGPLCSYIGHPLVERMDWIGALDPWSLRERLGLDAGRKTLVVLPGSRRSEIERLAGPFGDALAELIRRGLRPQVLVPVLPHVRDLVAAHAADWPVRPQLIEGEDDKFAAFKLADAALAASGTVTLEVALAGTPMIVAYRVDALAARLRFLVKTPHFALANLVLGRRAFPELMQEDCEPRRL
ncbi:MAG TPA: lipid-A-disaccharide synthase, partial [Hyphomicrobiaceae bacterium]|nr:lipid-A-disaccharide synthase [Hyphomicrobiaceae bacterium]